MTDGWTDGRMDRQSDKQTKKVTHRGGCTTYKENSCRSHKNFKQIEVLSFSCTMAAYLDIVEKIMPLSMVFEKNSLMAYEVVPAVQETIA